MEYAHALQLAEEARQALAPFCERIEIAGSVRRQKAAPRDIELVAVPRMVPAGLFSDALEVDPDFCAVVKQWPKVKGEPTGKYTQRLLPGGIKLDLFMADADNWGAIMLIRTGDWEFSKSFMGVVLPRHGYRQQDGYVWQAGQKVPVSDERTLFALMGMDFIDPTQRVGPVRAQEYIR